MMASSTDGALFVAEALTYGLIGAVFGYIIGQGVGTLLLHLGWLGNVTLNYSGTSAMLTPRARLCAPGGWRSFVKIPWNIRRR